METTRRACLRSTLGFALTAVLCLGTTAGSCAEPQITTTHQASATTAIAAPKQAGYPDPKRFEKAIVAFEKEDAATTAPRGAIVCIGSSSMAGWHKYLREDLAPLTVLPRGFGGSNMNDAAYYALRVVVAPAPRAVLYYEGDNDMAMEIPPETAFSKFQEFVNTVHHHLPEARIYVLSIKPSPSRVKFWPPSQQTNALLRKACEKDPKLTFIDVASAMFDANGKLREDIFLRDKLHMNRKGYEIWRDVVRPVLLKTELPLEKKR